MDQQRFDELTRHLATRRSRRSMLKQLIGGIFAGTAGGLGVESVSAQSNKGHKPENHHCKRAGKKCRNSRQCCSGLTCDSHGICSSGCHIDGQTYPPGQHPTDPCLTCDPDVSVTSWTVNAGAICGEGDACTTESVCQSDGTCSGATVPPTVHCPESQTLYSDSGMCGAVAIFTASADCAEVTCTQASGDTFSIGSTIVTCFAENAGGYAECSFTVDVSDMTPPTITCPYDILVQSNGLDPATVYYEVSASDNCSSVSVSCTPPSGSSFGLGWTQVDCSAIDTASIEATCQFNVVVECQPYCSGGLCGESDGCGGYCYGVCYDPAPSVCQTVECDTNVGACVVTSLPEGTDCQDNCNVGATCNGFGSCVGGFPLECTQDSNPCFATTGYCEPSFGCVFDQFPEGTICAELTDLCTPSLCNASGGCEQVVVTCSDDGCQFCDPTQGFCVNRDDNTACGGGSGICIGGFCEPL